jgi:hypothetical protein
MLPKTARIAGVALVSGIWSIALSTGCEDQCDPGWEIKNHECVRSAAAADGASADAGATGADAADDGTQEDAGGDGGDAGSQCTTSQLGVACRETTECTCDTSFCAANPGTVGFCTRTGCLQDASVCPSGWSCMDLASFGEGLPSICIPA